MAYVSRRLFKSIATVNKTHVTPNTTLTRPYVSWMSISRKQSHITYLMVKAQQPLGLATYIAASRTVTFSFIKNEASYSSLSSSPVLSFLFAAIPPPPNNNMYIPPTKSEIKQLVTLMVTSQLDGSRPEGRVRYPFGKKEGGLCNTIRSIEKN